jgi:hypothetical protein
MLDLDKLAKSLRDTLAKQTPESIDKWFKEYDMEDQKRKITFEIEIDVCDFLAEDLACMLAGTYLFGKCIAAEDKDEEVAVNALAEKLKTLIVEKVGIDLKKITHSI